MNRRELLDRASATAEERLLLGRVWDKYEQCRSRCVPTHTEFLSPQEQAAARRLLQAIGAEESEYACFGGYEGAERHILYSVIGREQIEAVISAIRGIDAKAFINVINTEQINGRFYRPPTR